MNRPFIHDDFLLQTKAARRLYHEFAASQPIVDYHCHLPPQNIAINRQFQNLCEIWLEGDHYKWRAMRSNGVAEQYCTGDAPPFEKFKAWAATVPHTLRNPLYHWTHLELKRYFGIDDLLSEHTAQSVWDRANEQLATPQLSTQGILETFNVQLIGTTDDPTDELVSHQRIAMTAVPTRVIPTFRPDKAWDVHQPDQWNSWVSDLENISNLSIANWSDFLDALKARHDFFHYRGARMSDHGLERCVARFTSDAEVARIFEKARAGKAASEEEREKFASHLMLCFGRWNAEKGWTMQLHLGARRNNNSRLFEALGPDAGFDSISDCPQVDALARFLDLLDRENALPKTILYNLNPADNYAFGTMLGNFQDGSVPGKLQLGSGWWFLDQKEAMEWQLNTLSNLGLLSHFIGMVTDSRSFMSFPRHEYFRRVLCNLIGRDVENGELPDDDALLQPLIENICHRNARMALSFTR